MAELNLDADWSADVDTGGTKYPSDGFDSAGSVSGFGDLRIGVKWDISSLPATATVDQVGLTLEVIAVSGVSGDNWDIGPYNGDGQADPESDAGSTMYSRCDVSSDLYVDDTTQLRTTGTKTFSDLGAAAEADVEAARDAGTIFSIGIRMSVEPGSGDEYSALDEYDATNPPVLTITYTPATTYSLTAETGAFTLTGIAVGLVAHRLLALAVGAFTLTGVAVTFAYGKTLLASVGSFALTGQNLFFVLPTSLSLSFAAYGPSAGENLGYNGRIVIGDKEYTNTRNHDDPVVRACAIAFADDGVSSGTVTISTGTLNSPQVTLSYEIYEGRGRDVRIHLTGPALSGVGAKESNVIVGHQHPIYRLLSDAAIAGRGDTGPLYIKAS